MTRGEALAFGACLVAATFAAACSKRAAPPEDHGPKLVSFASTDGVTLKADLYGTGDRGVVLAHGGRFHRDSFAPLARELATFGFRALAIDFRYENEGGGSAEDAMPLLDRDVLGAVRFLRAAGAKSVSVVGGSLGGFAAGNASVECNDREIDRVVLLAHSPIDAPERMKGRKLFILAKDDPGPGGKPRLEAIRDQFERASEPKELVLLDGAAHAQAIFSTAQGPELTARIARFLTSE